MRPALFGLAGLAAAMLCSCARPSADTTTCRGDASGDDEIQAKLAACARLIKAGARGEDLEQALAARGEAYRLASDDAHAIADLDQALRLDPRDSAALDSRGLAHIDAGKPDLALADFNAAISANAGDGDAFDNRGYLERTRGELDAAILDEGRAIELEPKAALPWANRGYDYAGKHWWDFAIADFDDSLTRAPDYAFALQGRAESERGKGDSQAALKDFKQILNDPHGDNALDDANAVVDLSPAGDPEALNARCWVHGVLNTELQAALADCKQSLATRPNSAETLDSLAFIYFRLGRFDDAVNEYTAALAADPKQAQSLFMRGVAKLRVGDKTGEDDITAATAADKNVADPFASWGVKP